eukprot:6001140-Prymnesium_polylepis.1
MRPYRALFAAATRSLRQQPRLPGLSAADSSPLLLHSAVRGSNSGHRISSRAVAHGHHLLLLHANLLCAIVGATARGGGERCNLGGGNCEHHECRLPRPRVRKAMHESAWWIMRGRMVWRGLTAMGMSMKTHAQQTCNMYMLDCCSCEKSISLEASLQDRQDGYRSRGWGPSGYHGRGTVDTRRLQA